LQIEGNVSDVYGSDGFVFQQENVKTSDPKPLSVCRAEDYS